MNNKCANLVVAVIFSLSTGIVLGEGKIENHAHEFASDVDDFHAVLAPLWHANPGKERTRSVCAQTDELNDLGRRIQSGDPEALLSSIAELRKECQEASPEIEAVFSQVHHAFHNLVEHRER